jgi:hypothetical protein
MQIPIVGRDQVAAAITQLDDVHGHGPLVAAICGLGDRAPVALDLAGDLDDRLERAIAQDRAKLRAHPRNA